MNGRCARGSGYLWLFFDTGGVSFMLQHESWWTGQGAGNAYAPRPWHSRRAHKALKHDRPALGGRALASEPSLLSWTNVLLPV